MQKKKATIKKSMFVNYTTVQRARNSDPNKTQKGLE